ncbi:AI-2E family transporter [Aquimarina intermedia]|uniref:Putative PurR-regulated permease PerM n=1 Tax=Aquimarina intermedia TaxID=350814 RepID=A0A5S5C6H0_9FLAO|nr:AI-2E family transporter [Aquimarina intermedia]TYP74198.1 putative PurR-regulated permease PerM [Aquimarina intermedia]
MSNSPNRIHSKAITLGILKAVGVLVAVAVVLWFLYKIQSVLVYIAFAAVISLMGRPLVVFFKRRLHFRNTIAVICTLFIITILFLSIFTLFIPIVIEQAQLIGEINIENVGDDLDQLNNQISEFFGINRLSFVELVKQSDLVNFINFRSIPDMVNSFLNIFGSVMLGIFSILFISFFFLKDSQILEGSLLAFAQQGDEGKFRTAFNKIKDLLSRYFVGLLLQITIIFVLYTILLLVFGINNAIAIALIAAIFNIIPYIGPLVGGMFIIVLATTSNLGMDFSTVIFPKLVYIVIGYMIVQLVDNFFNQPIIFGNSVKSHPLEIFLVIIIGGLLFGIGGMIVAIPAYTSLKVIAKEFWSEYKIVAKLTKDL